MESEATYIEGVSPEDFSHADTYIHSDQGDTTCCDDIPDLTEDISQVESLPLSEQEDLLSEQCNDLDPTGSSDMEGLRKRKISPQSGKSSWGFSESKDSVENKSKPKSEKPAVPEKPKLVTSQEDIAITELPSESDSEGLSVKQNIVPKLSELVTVTEMDYSEATDINQNLTARSVDSEKAFTNSSVVNGDVTSKPERKSKERTNSNRDSKKSSFSEKSKNKDKGSDVISDNSSMTTPSKTKRSRRKQVW